MLFRSLVQPVQLRAKLNGLNEEVEICDSSGVTVGYFLPEEQYLHLVYAWAKATMSIEELKRRAAEPGGMKLADFWKRMEEAAGRHTDEEVDRLRQQTGGRRLADIFKDLEAG